MSNGEPDERTQEEEPRPAATNLEDEATLSAYLNAPQAEEIGGAIGDPEAGLGAASTGGGLLAQLGAGGGGAGGPGLGGGAGALMLPMLLAQMQQQQQANQRVMSSPLTTFANAYATAMGRPQPIQPQTGAAGGTGPMQMLQVMKAIDESQHRQRSDLLNQKKYDETLKSNALREENIRSIIKGRQQTEQQRQDQDFVKLLGTVNTGTPAGQEFYGNQMARIAARMGAPEAKPEFFRQRMKLTPDERKDFEVIALGVHEGSLTLEDAQAKYPNLDPNYLATTVKMMGNPLLRKAAGVPDDGDIRAHAAANAQKEMDAWAPTHGYTLTGPEAPRFMYAADFFRGKTGKAIYQADEKDPADLSLLAQAKQYGIDQVEKEYQRKRADHRADQDYTNKNIIDRQLAAEARQPVASKSVIDMTTGILMTPTKQEWAQNPRRYRFPTATEEQQLTYLTTAMPNFNAIETLVDRILVDKGPDNLINALQGRIGSKMGTDQNWRALDTLLSDTNIELTRALGGGGQFRTQLLDYVKRANITGRDTREVSHGVINIMRNQVENRRQSIISGGNLDALKTPPLPVNPVSKTIRIRDAKGRILTAPAGTPIPPGATVIP